MDSDPGARGTVDRVYEALKNQAISYAIKPGSRLNEGEVARKLGVSRTPVREALNRLTATGFLSFTPSQGFFRKPLDPTEVFDLYEMRQAIEVASVRLAATRATEAGLRELDEFLAISAGCAEGREVDQLVRFDEEFHERIVRLSGNREMLSCLLNINDRIRFFRWVDMESGRRRNTQEEHREVPLALAGARRRARPRPCCIRISRAGATRSSPRSARATRASMLAPGDPQAESGSPAIEKQI